MTAEEMMSVLLSYERKLSTIADQAHETREQAQHTLDRVNRLRRDLGLFRQHLGVVRDAASDAPAESFTGLSPAAHGRPPGAA
jgi:hypothetical protein